AARTQTAERALERLLSAERLYRHISPVPGQPFDFRQHIDLPVVQHHVTAHRARHRQTIRVAVNTDDKPSAHQLRTDPGAQSDWPLREDDHRISYLDAARLCPAKSRRSDV